MSDLPPPNPYTSPGYNPYAAPNAPAYAPPAASERYDYRPPAPAGIRIVAYLIDTMAVGLPAIGVGAIVGYAAEMLTPESRDTVLAVLPIMAIMPGAILESVLQATTGQSLGKRLMKLQVVTLDDQPASFVRVFFLRNVVPMAISMLCNLLSIADALSLFRRDGRTIHDRLAATRVVRVG